MTAYAFTQHHDPDDVASRELVSKISLLGFMCLIVMERLFPAVISADRLAYRFKISDKRKTLDPVLADLWTYGYASHVGTDNWRITDNGRQAISHLIASTATSMDRLPSRSQLALPMVMTDGPILEDKHDPDPPAEIFSGTLSSSSSDLDQSVFSGSDLISEEEDETEKISETDRRARLMELLDLNGITGDKRAAVVSDIDANSLLTPELFEDWLAEVNHMADRGFRFRKSRVAYAITCMLKHELPPSIMERRAQARQIAAIRGDAPQTDSEIFSESEAVELPAAPLPVEPSPAEDTSTDSVVELDDLWTRLSASVESRSVDFHRFVFVHCQPIAIDGSHLIVHVPRGVHDLFEQSRPKLEAIVSDLAGNITSIISQVY